MKLIKTYRDDKGCFIRSIAYYSVCTDITRYANMFALMFLLVNGDKCRKIAENVLCDSFIAVELHFFERNGNLRYC